MIKIDDDQQTIHITRGDEPQAQYNKLCFYFPILNLETGLEENYKFQLNDNIRLVVFDKKGYTKEEIFRIDWKVSELGYTEPTETPEIPLTDELMKKFPLQNKRKVYWYDIVLNENSTLLGMDDEGAAKMYVYPGTDIESEDD